MYRLKRYTTLPTKYWISLASRATSFTSSSFVRVTPVMGVTLYTVHQTKEINQFFHFIFIYVLRTPKIFLTM